MPVERARALIRTFLEPVTATERVHVRQSLGRVLAVDIVSPFPVPGDDNSAMDGYAVRFADLSPDRETTLVRVGESFAGKPSGATIDPGECVRIFTGGVMPDGADSVVMQERTRVEGEREVVAAGALMKAGQNRRFAGEDLKPGQVVFAHGTARASRGTGHDGVARHRRSYGLPEAACRVLFHGDELRSVGAELAAGEVYDSNRYTIYGMLDAAGSCDLLDMGVVPDVPEALERRSPRRGRGRRRHHIRRRVGRRGRFRQAAAGQTGRGAVLEDRDEARSPLAYGRIGSAHFFGLPGNPVSVMVTFYEFVQDAMRIAAGPP